MSNLVKKLPLPTRNPRGIEARCEDEDRPDEFEIATTGFDEFLQLVGGDPQGSSTSVGLRVPTAPTPSLTTRYLFLLALFSVGEGARVRIRGYRQLTTIGAALQVGTEEAPQVRVIEQLVASPFWRFPDGNVSWHLHLVGGPNSQQVPDSGRGPVDLPSFAFMNSTAPALLYGRPAPAPPAGGIYTNVTGYVPPNLGRPWGQPIKSKHGTFYDQRTEWTTHGAWHSLDIPVRGPETVALFASVRQTDPTSPSRNSIPLPGTVYPGGLSPEEQFLLNFPTAIYWRVGGALVVEEW